MVTKQKIKELAEQVTEQARHLVSKAQGLPSEVIEAYNFMADQCKEYYTGSNIENYTARVSIYALSALGVVRSYGQTISQNVEDKLNDSINELIDFSKNNWIEAQNIKRRVNEAELTDGQKVFVEEAATLIAYGIVSAAAVVGVTATAAAVVAVVTAGICIAVASMGVSPALVAAGFVMAFSPHIMMVVGGVAGSFIPPIYSMYQDVCKFKEQNSDKKLTPKELWNIIDKTDHMDQGVKLISSAIESAIDSVIKSLTLKNQQFLESGLKKAIVAKEVTKSVGKNLSNAVASSKVGKTANRAKNIIQRSASRAKVKFTDVVKNAREKVGQGIGSPSRK